MTRLAFSRIRAKAGSSKPANVTVTDITTSNSVMLNARRAGAPISFDRFLSEKSNEKQRTDRRSDLRFSPTVDHPRFSREMPQKRGWLRGSSNGLSGRESMPLFTSLPDYNRNQTENIGFLCNLLYAESSSGPQMLELSALPTSENGQNHRENAVVSGTVHSPKADRTMTIEGRQ